MKILAKYIATDTQIHNGKCYFIGLVSEYDGAAYNIESGGSSGTGNQVGMVRREHFGTCILPKPGVECSNGLYVVAAGLSLVFYSLG